jgi:APA family basic amino acid/polyamine antiporter
MHQNAPLKDSGLIRAIGVRQLTASIVNVTIGAGIFVLPATVAMGLGSAAPLAYIACALLMALIVWCFAAAGSRVALTGGLYAYVEVAFGGFAGFLCGTLYWVASLATVASVAAAFAGSLGVVWAGASTGPGRWFVLAALFALLAWLNVRGVKVGARLIEASTVAKIIPLIVFVAAGAWFIHPEYLRWQSPPALSQVGQTSILLIFAFVGIEVALAPSGEVLNPARTVPRSIFTALGITTLMYLAIQAVAQGVLGPDMSAYAAAPLAEGARRVLGRSGELFVLAGATVSMFGYVSGDMLSTPRVIYAFGRDGALPGVLARVNPRFHTPAVAIVVYAVVACIVAASSTFERLAVLSNVVTLLMYLMCVAAAVQLQRNDVQAGGVPLKLPAGALIPVLAATGIIWLVVQATWWELGITGLLLITAAAYYRVTHGRTKPETTDYTD